MEGDERTFRVTFDEEGAEKLGGRLTEKLKEYMGEYVDDTLVKYVIVLLGNGRSKEEVKDELDVFLGDNTDSFVTWLWDHLASDLDQYLPSHKTSALEVPKAKPELAENVDKNDSDHLVSESGRTKSKYSKSRHNRDWKGLVTDDTQPPPLRSTIAEHVQHEGKTHRSTLRARRSVSPEPAVNRKRDRPAERPQVKREVSAPRRLLQFAVREAVATAMPSSSTEPTRKRLRSVVSTTSTGNSSEEVHPRRIQSVARLANPMATAIKAVAEAAEDVRKVRTGNVFDRLSRGADVQEDIEQISTFRGLPLRDDGYEVCEQIDEKSNRRYLHTTGYVGGYNVNASMIDNSTVVASDSASDHEEYDDGNFVDHKEMNGTQTGTSRGYTVDYPYLVQSSVAQDSDEFIHHQTRKNGNEQPVSVPNAKHKIVNISVNVNTWKPPHFQPSVETRKSMQATDSGGGNANIRLMKENSSPVTTLGNGKPAADTQKESQQTVTPSAPGSYSTGRPLEDAESRTVFVNNVHFAATKDSLSRHFNKFGEVLKVIILTDAATGHPKGSAYVEFMRKEAAENALSLDGTSFMSRIIKVVKKSSGQQEPNPTMTWPRVTRGSPFAVPRFAQSPFPRVFPGAYRARPPIKQGARSMQWKRDAQQTSAESAPGNSANVLSAGRGLTYVRTEPKSDANPGGV